MFKYTLGGGGGGTPHLCSCCRHGDARRSMHSLHAFTVVLHPFGCSICPTPCFDFYVRGQNWHSATQRHTPQVTGCRSRAYSHGGSKWCNAVGATAPVAEAPAAVAESSRPIPNRPSSGAGSSTTTWPATSSAQAKTRSSTTSVLVGELARRELANASKSAA